MNLNLDLKDKKILYELDLDSRQSNKQIARKVGLSEMVTSNRIKRLIDKKIIEKFYVKINPKLLGYYHVKIFLKLHNITKEKEEELLNYLNSKSEILWLVTVRGKYELIVSILIQDLTEYSKKYQEIFGEWGNYIYERSTIFVEKASTFNKAFLLPKQKTEEVYYGVGELMPKIDQKDLHLLNILNKEGRKPIIDIAKEIKLSADAVKYRLNNLQKKKIITGFGVKIDFNKLGDYYYLIFLRFQNMDEDKYNKLKTLCKLSRNVLFFIRTIGDHDIELEVEISAKEELDQLIRSIRDHFLTEIKDFEILEVTKEHRLSYYPF